MKNSFDKATALFIVVAALACAVAMLLVPGLFADFTAGRFTAVLVLAGVGVALAFYARRFRSRARSV